MDIRTNLYNTKKLLLLNESYMKSIETCNKTIQKTADLREKFAQAYNEQVDEINKIFDILKQIPKANQEIIKQIYFEHKSIESIAKHLNCTEDDVLKIHDLSLKQMEDLIK
mgnify:CR=1 FL=1